MLAIRNSRSTYSKSKNRRFSLARLVVIAAVGFKIALLVFLILWLKELGIFKIDDRSIATIVNHQPSDNSVVYDRNGAKLGEFFSSYHVYTPYEKLPASFIKALLAIEDRSFFSHPGFDLKGITRALLSRLKGHSSRQGASTLTQQIVRYFLLPKERSVQRKVQEIALAIQLERRVSKERILEIYANTLFLGNGSYGIGAAAQRYFGKQVGELSLAEAALIAGLYQSPSRYNPARHPRRAKRRQLRVLSAMVKAKFVTLAEARKAATGPLRYKDYRPARQETAPYFVDYVRAQTAQILKKQGININNGGLRIQTTLDLDLQKKAEQALAANNAQLSQAQLQASFIIGQQSLNNRKRGTVEAAIVSVQPSTGEILTMVGGRDYERSQFNRTTQAKRSPGSAFKPILFSYALSKGWKWSDVIFVAPVTIANYRPKTAKNDYLTETTLLRAFYQSINSPAIELAQKLGLQKIIGQAQKLGVRSKLKSEFGTMLGSSDVTMLDLARVYQSFANQGTLVEQIAITRITDRSGRLLYEAPLPKSRSTKVLEPDIAYLMTKAMQNVLSHGTGYRSAQLAGHVAGKTGTANDSTDNWFCGYSKDLVTITWVGTDEHVGMSGKVGGGRIALPIFDSFMSSVRQAVPANRRSVAEAFPRPSNVASAQIDPRFGYPSDRGITMYFLEGNGPQESNEALEALSELEEGTPYRAIFAN